MQQEAPRAIFEPLALLESVLDMKAWGVTLLLAGGLVTGGCASDSTSVPIAEGIFAELGAPLPSATAEQLAVTVRWPRMDAGRCNSAVLPALVPR